MANIAKYSVELANRLAGIVSAGKPTTVACRIEGISRTAYYLWLRDHPEFAALMEQAEGKRIEQRLANIDAKSDKDWRADAWILERTVPEFRETKDVSITVRRAFHAMVEAVREHMSTAAYGELVEAIARIEAMDSGAAALPEDAGGEG